MRDARIMLGLERGETREGEGSIERVRRGERDGWTGKGKKREREDDRERVKGTRMEWRFRRQVYKQGILIIKNVSS